LQRHSRVAIAYPVRPFGIFDYFKKKTGQEEKQAQEAKKVEVQAQAVQRVE
jgi:hypothetical protein